MNADTEALRALDQDDLIALDEGVMHAEMMDADKVQMDTSDARLLIEAAREAIRLRAEVERMRGDDHSDLKQRLDDFSAGANPGPYGVDSYGSGTTYLTLGSWVGHYASDTVRMMGRGRAEIVNSNVPSAWGEDGRKGATAHFLAEIANAYREGRLRVVGMDKAAAPEVQP